MPEVTSDEVGHAFLNLYKRLHRLVDEEMTCSGVSLSRTKVLGELSEHGPMNQATIATLLGLTPRSVTDIIDTLTRDDYAARSPDPADRRAWIVAITPAGTDAYQRSMAAKSGMFDQIFGVLNPAERAKFVALLTKINASLSSGESLV
jgi:DNA-binding MarR family transcriptional regulator